MPACRDGRTGSGVGPSPHKQFEGVAARRRPPECVGPPSPAPAATPLLHPCRLFTRNEASPGERGASCPPARARPPSQPRPAAGNSAATPHTPSPAPPAAAAWPRSAPSSSPPAPRPRQRPNGSSAPTPALRPRPPDCARSTTLLNVLCPCRLERATCPTAQVTSGMSSSALISHRFFCVTWFRWMSATGRLSLTVKSLTLSSSKVGAPAALSART